MQSPLLVSDLSNWGGLPSLNMGEAVGGAGLRQGGHLQLLVQHSDLIVSWASQEDVR